jgi:arylsulfatase A-like enzyme
MWHCSDDADQASPYRFAQVSCRHTRVLGGSGYRRRPVPSESAIAPPAPNAARLGPAVGAAASGAAIYGLADGLLVAGQSHLLPSALRTTVLVVLDALGTASLGLATGLGLVGLVAIARQAKVKLPLRAGPPAWWGLLSGLAAAGLVDVASVWFTDPPPFTEGFPYQGNPLVFLAVAAGICGAVAPLLILPRRGLTRLAVVTGLLLLLGVRVGAAKRDLAPLGVPPQGAPNVVLVTLDTVRADAFGALGAGDDQTRHFDGLARDGVLFTQAMAAIPVTGPSHLTIMSGEGPWQHGNLLNGLPLPDDLPLLAERLRAEGWQTGGFVSAYVLDGDLGFARGFQVYDDDFGWLQGWEPTLPGRLVSAVGRKLAPDAVLERRGERTTDSALSWLARVDGPFFLWVHLFDAHGPYTPPPPWDTAYYSGDPRDPATTSMPPVSELAAYMVPSLAGITDVEWVRAQYKGEVSYVDAQLGRLLEALDTQGLTDTTLVVVAGDHGEALGEHGQWFDHGDDLYEPAMHVPLAMRMPGRLPAGVRVDPPVELTDIEPTVLRLLGLDDEAPHDGRSLLGQIAAAPVRAPDTRVFARGLTFDRPFNLSERAAGRIERPKWRLVALRGDDSRFVHHEADTLPDSYFDLRADPQELSSVVPEPELLGLLQGEAGRLLSAMDPDAVDRSGTELDEATRARLKALGYVE